MKFKKEIEISGENFKNNKQIYIKIIDILEDALKYDDNKKDVQSTIFEVEEHLNGLKNEVI